MQEMQAHSITSFTVSLTQQLQREDVDHQESGGIRNRVLDAALLAELNPLLVSDGLSLAKPLSCAKVKPKKVKPSLGAVVGSI
jgi:hypothetical protein